MQSLLYDSKGIVTGLGPLNFTLLLVCGLTVSALRVIVAIFKLKARCTGWLIAKRSEFVLNAKIANRNHQYRMTPIVASE